MTTIKRATNEFETCWRNDIAAKIKDVIDPDHMDLIKSACMVAYAQGRIDGDAEYRDKLENVFAQFDRPQAIDGTVDKLMDELGGKP